VRSRRSAASAARRSASAGCSRKQSTTRVFAFPTATTTPRSARPRCQRTQPRRGQHPGRPVLSKPCEPSMPASPLVRSSSAAEELAGRASWRRRGTRRGDRCRQRPSRPRSRTTRRRRCSVTGSFTGPSGRHRRGLRRLRSGAPRRARLPTGRCRRPRSRARSVARPEHREPLAS
jgi:hypothetical protein